MESVTDPEAHWFRGTRWFLWKSAVSLERDAEWADDVVGVVCVEAVRERRALTPWKGPRGRVLYVSRSSVEAWCEGRISESERYKLRSLSLQFSTQACGG